MSVDNSKGLLACKDTSYHRLGPPQVQLKGSGFSARREPIFEPADMFTIHKIHTLRILNVFSKISAILFLQETTNSGNICCDAFCVVLGIEMTWLRFRKVSGEQAIDKLAHICN